MRADKTRKFTRRDHCPQCGDVHFVCTEYMSNDQIFLYEEQCPRCYDFWQIGFDDTLNNCDTLTSKDLI